MIKVIDWRVKIPNSVYSIQHYHYEPCGSAGGNVMAAFTNSTVDDQTKKAALQPLGPVP